MPKLHLLHIRLLFTCILGYLFPSPLHAQTHEFDFEYRDVYFPQVSNQEKFKKEYHTMPLDDYWGMWGHNLHKWIPFYIQEDSEIYALVNNKRNTEQFCFSSDVLKEIINKNIKQRQKLYQYYMISPSHSALVCQCPKCIAKGNTPIDASPALFDLLQSLAKDFKKMNFFTSVYLSIKTPPKDKVPKNVGVFISTIDYQKGKPYQQLKNVAHLKQTIDQWKEKVNKIYVWEYVLNYDNYFDFYPNLKVLQSNLQFLKRSGVTGVFLNGSERYSILQEIKASCSAQFLINVDADLDELISEEIKKFYPPQTAMLLTEYYTCINQEFYNSNKVMGIYSGIQDALLKYLSVKDFYDFYDRLLVLANQNEEKNNSSAALVLAATFFKLELMRSQGIKETGYAEIQSHQLFIKEEVKTLLLRLKNLSIKNDIHSYNEAGDLIATYLDQWNKTIEHYPQRNYFLNKKFEVLSQLDAGYDNKHVLNDGAIGFLDYNTNWLICSKDDELIITLNPDHLPSNIGKLSIGFLNDPKHHIYFPEAIKIKNRSKTISSIEIPTSDEHQTKSIEIPINKEDFCETLQVIISKKTGEMSKSALACDEITIE